MFPIRSLLAFLVLVDASANTVWKLTDIQDQYLFGASSTSSVQSVKECAESCTLDCQCQSFGFNTQTYNCSLYNYLVWSGGLFVVQPYQRYYWALQDECPITQGYQLGINETVCYKVYNMLKPWKQLIKLCIIDRGHVFIADTDERMDLANASLPGQDKYLGGNDLNEDGVWNWVNGRPISSSVWTPGQPNNYLERQHCLTVGMNVGAGDIFCALPKAFICEIPIL